MGTESSWRRACVLAVFAVSAASNVWHTGVSTCIGWIEQQMLSVAGMVYEREVCGGCHLFLSFSFYVVEKALAVTKLI
jgi:hypothetical protein